MPRDTCNTVESEHANERDLVASRVSIRAVSNGNGSVEQAAGE